jgi:hypothetical protein
MVARKPDLCAIRRAVLSFPRTRQFSVSAEAWLDVRFCGLPM